MPDFYDTSTSPAFPAVGNQGPLNSCVSWALTYYQFTYEVNKYKNTTANTSTIYSPSWTFNLTNYGNNLGTNKLVVYDILKKRGALLLSDYGYNYNNFNYSWPTDTDKMVEALNTRVSAVENIYISCTGTPISNQKDTDLNSVKQYLASGKTLSINISADSDGDYGFSNWSVKNGYGNYSSYKTCYRSSHGNSGHCMLVVGYDDNFECDVNGNGVIDYTSNGKSYEKGAFKVVNSWGTSSYNNGYVWVMYDALNLVSANTKNNWENSETGTRESVFKYTTGNPNSYANAFSAIFIEEKSPMLIGELTLTTPLRNSLDIAYASSTNTTFPSTYEWFCMPTYNSDYSNQSLSFSGTLVFDYNEYASPIGTKRYGYNWFIRLSTINEGSITNMSFKIVDSKRTTVNNFYSLPALVNKESQEHHQINLQLGDLDYSGTVNSADLLMLSNYVAEIEEPSNLQYFLADYYVDGVVDLKDMTALSRYLNGSN